jgi:hypothetical protein
LDPVPPHGAIGQNAPDLQLEGLPLANGTVNGSSDKSHVFGIGYLQKLLHRITESGIWWDVIQG